SARIAAHSIATAALVKEHTMKELGRAFALGILAIFVNVTIVGQARADESCHNIVAKGVGQDLGGGSTQAQIIGGGLLHGTTLGSFVITGVSGTVASFTGTIEFTTQHGTLTVTVAGTLDVSTGEFSASGMVTGA